MVNIGDDIGTQYFQKKGWKPFSFQKACWKAYLEGKNGLLNAPTGSGKTYALWFGILQEYLNTYKPDLKRPPGLQVIWITPVRALAEEILQASMRVVAELGINFEVGIRTGDTSTSVRAKQTRSMPQMLITTPESLHLLLAQKDYPNRFKNLRCVVADEWHELMGSKRGVQLELALSRLKNFTNLKIWGISATIGNMEESLDVLFGSSKNKPYAVIKADIEKKIDVVSILPDEIERFPWSGHLGIKLLEKIIPLIEKSESTLIFTNTRSQTEIWYTRIMELAPHLVGLVAMHHGSIAKDIRNWVENAIHNHKLKAVVCTSSLDLGVDFRPVETIIQIGSPRGVSRFMQRAGRSGHQPGARSRIYFVPTHSLELLEGAALRQAIKEHSFEDRIPFVNSLDVLIQYLVTLAVSEGFRPEQIYTEIKSTYAYQYLSDEDWKWVLNFIVSGGDTLSVYDEYHKVEILENGVYKVTNRRIAMRHRLSMGTIVSDQALMIRYLNGKKLGTIEEYFISKLKIGDVFWFAGRPLELTMVRYNDVYVRQARNRKGIIPSWQGSKMNLSSQLSEMIRRKLSEAIEGDITDPELEKIIPLIMFQQERSHVPTEHELLIEMIETKEGYHVFVYPFEGRFIHEGFSSLMAYRITKIKKMTYSIGFNDYGFELLSDEPIPIEEALSHDLFSTENLLLDIQASLNSSELAKRRFYDIAHISGLVFKGFPGKNVSDKHLQSSSSTIFQAFMEYDPNNLLLKQAYQEAFDFQIEEERMRSMLERIQNQKIILTRPDKPTPFCFPIMTDRIRQRYVGQSLSEQIKKMTLQFE